MSAKLHCNAIIFDLGDVLFSWSSSTRTSISPKVLRCILSSPTWFEYERGRLSQEACYATVGQEFSLDPGEIASAFEQARDSLASNDKLISVVREMKAEANSGLRVFALSNISVPDFEVLRTKPADWSIFDEVFTSGHIGERKPNLGIYRHVIAKTGIEPARTIFVDDKTDNVLSARSLGLQGITFDTTEQVIRELRNLICDPVQRGQTFLKDHAKALDSVTDGGVVVKENFAQLLILEATRDRSLVDLSDPTPRTWNFFNGKPIFTTEEFPFDLDTTSLGLTVVNTDETTAQSVMNEMLDYVNDDGIIQTYFDHRRPRFDPVVCVNALSLFCFHGRGSELSRTLEWTKQVLTHRAYLHGTRYYATAECFLFFLSRLIEGTDREDVQALKPVLKERVEERMGAEGDALALAMRIIVCAHVGVRDDVDLRRLLHLQCEDGGWEIGWIYKYGSSGIKLGNRGLTTCLAIKAIQAMDRPELVRRPSAELVPTEAAAAFMKPVPLPIPAVPQQTRRHSHRRSLSRLYSDSLRRSMSYLLPGGFGKPIEAGH